MQPRIIDGKYEIVRELSKGGMGAVFEARHLLTRRRVALKLILAETLARKRPEDALRRFEREARAAGSIESRHVVSVLDTGIDVATTDHYIVMELLLGEDLRQLVRRAGKLPPNLVLSIARQVCVGLRRAHEQGIVHRDIKSGNIFLARRDDGHIEVKILDFGIAKLRVDPLAALDGHDLTRSGSVVGSPLYMSPEQATGSREVDARSDIWSLGVVMYEALTGETPQAQRALGAVILAICSEPARPLREREPSIPADVAAIVHKALALEPGQRFASAEAMQTAIEALLPEGQVIHDRMLDELPEGAVLEKRADAADSASGGASTQPHQTTVDAVTYGSGSAKQAGRGWSPRAKRTLALGAAIAGVVAALAFSRSRAEVPLQNAEGTASMTPVAAMAGPAAQKATPLPPVPPSAAPPRASEKVPTATAANVSVPAQRPVIRRERTSAPPVPKTGSVPPPTTAFPESAAPPPPAAPRPPPPRPAGNEPAIDRRFD